MIIGISGKQGSGKTSLARALAELTDKAVILKFADPMYQMHDAVNSVYNHYGVPTPQKDGELLQWIGTEHGRNKDENIWVNIMHTRLLSAYAQDVPVIIDDMRFENEFDMIEELGGMLIRLDASEEVRSKRTDGWRENTTHPSELGLDNYAQSGKFDLYLGTEGEFEDTVSGVIQEIANKFDH
jgi:dephospho-CoA kinase